MTFDNNLFAVLVHTEKGTTCSDSGLQDLSTDQECSDAVNYAKSFNVNAEYKYSESSSSYPKGCYILSGGRMYFNRDSTGKNQAGIRSICHKGNY